MPKSGQAIDVPVEYATRNTRQGRRGPRLQGSQVLWNSWASLETRRRHKMGKGNNAKRKEVKKPKKNKDKK
jgi:hypothetical protein